jgi:putative transposase
MRWRVDGISRVLSVVDAYTRECLALEVDTSFSGLRLTRVLEAAAVERGLPAAIRCDNGPEGCRLPMRA